MTDVHAHKSGAPDPLIGRVIAGRFTITSLIARGGMGKVYRAEQSPLGRVCAIKILNPNYNGDADPEFHRRFFREASVTSKIMHPNSVTIFDYGKTEDDIYFMAMEYLEGKTLHMALREVRVMPELRAGRIASQICRALREAHKLGVIHRDLKPANVFLTRPSTNIPDVDGSMPPTEEDEDFVKVLDFGLVKHLAERPEEQLTQTGLFMGSPKYMAPEQIQGGHVDERTDIYSLGIIMYEMLAGKVPFERATSVNILMAHVGEPPPLMREVNPHLVCSPAFEDLVMCCIAKDPNERFSSMEQVLGAIRRAHGGSMTGPVAALTASGQYRANVTGSSLRHAPVTGPPPPMAMGPGQSWSRMPVGAVSGSYPPAVGRTPSVGMRAAGYALSGAPGSIPPPPRVPSMNSGAGHEANSYENRAPRSVRPTSMGRVSSAPPPPHGAYGASVPSRSVSSPPRVSVPPRAPDYDASTAPGHPRDARHSRTTVTLGVVLAVAVGGVLGLLAFRWTSADREPPIAIRTTATAPVLSVVPAPLASPSASPGSAAELTSGAKTTIKVTTDPPGAAVREDTKELCSTTPCDLTLDTSKPHKLVLTHAGFRPEMRTIRSSDGTLQVKFSHAVPK